ncbi:MAG: N-acetyltransferase [Candidatus Micrarchaeaceae archaeon]|jgi:ribosomal protein S18 acetylase RimI-like enzyme
MNVKIRNMNLKDVGAVYRLGIKTEEFYSSDDYGTWYPKDALEEWLKYKKDDVLLVAESNNKVVGFALTYVHFKKWALLDSAAVLPKYRKKGIGNQLMDQTLARLKKIGVVYAQGFIRNNNKQMLKYIKKFGFEIGNNFYVVDRLFEENFKR